MLSEYSNYLDANQSLFTAARSQANSNVHDLNWKSTRDSMTTNPGAKNLQYILYSYIHFKIHFVSYM